MALTGLSKFFTGSKEKKHRPMFNEVPFVKRNGAVSVGMYDLRKQNFVNWFKTRPELCAPVTIRVNDTITEVEFYDIDGSPLGRNKYLQAKKFWDGNQLYKRLKSYQYDRLITGSGFLWKGTALNQRSSNKQAYLEQIKQISSRIAKTTLGNIQTREADYLTNKLFLRAMDEDLRTVRVVDYLPSSTVVIEHDLYEIKKYVQIFSTHTEDFSPEEIIHTRFMDIDGKVDGFTPIMSLTYEMILVWAIKENMLSYFRNGAVTGKMIIMPEEVNTSENFKWLKSELMNNGILENRHGHMLLTGNVDVKDLEDNLKDMEYENLFMHIKSNIANALNVPLSRMGDYQAKGGASDAGGLADSGYWSGVEADQRVIEMDLNSQLFNDLGFSIRFKKPYKIDEVREAQAANQNISFILQANNGLRNNYKKRIKLDSYLSLISGNSREVSTSDIEDMPDDVMMSPMEKNSMLNQTFMKDNQVIPNKSQQNKAEQKQTESTNNAKGSNQGGF
ncbi:MAG: phage portal protein [Candidatus Izemoplasmatales bacterium]|nr:phage portal protein [Candidatus Izemoplasmatales bacterium]